jgi:ribosomal-protein-alanine N-acetyltransferase
MCTLTSERLTLRPMQTGFVTQQYLDWLSDQEINRFIVTAKTHRQLKNLEDYIYDKICSETVAFWAIFDQKTESHIGNIKYEPVDVPNSFAIMGIMIGEKKFRGIGIGPEAILLTSNWLKIYHGVTCIYLGVDKENFQARRSYIKMGFTSCESAPLGYIGNFDRENMLKLEL